MEYVGAASKDVSLRIELCICYVWHARTSVVHPRYQGSGWRTCHLSTASSIACLESFSGMHGARPAHLGTECAPGQSIRRLIFSNLANPMGAWNLFTCSGPIELILGQHPRVPDPKLNPAILSSASRRGRSSGCPFFVSSHDLPP